MNISLIGIVLVGTLTLACKGATTEDHKVALKGLDPVLLVQGKEVKGKSSLSRDAGKFRYLFATEADRAEFDKAPSKYSAQLDGKCLMMPAMPGNPDLFLVYEGKIYLAGDASCLAGAKANPAALIKSSSVRKKVAIMIFPGVQIIDYTGPYEVFGQAGYDVFTVAEKADPLVTSMGMNVVPNYTFVNCPKPDLIVTPGGNVPQQVEKKDPRIQWILTETSGGAKAMSVCNGAFWLANAGLLDGKNATTFYGMLKDLKTKFPNVHVLSDKRFADNGDVMCTAGLSSGIDGALHMVGNLEGAERAKSIALNMEYNWQPELDYSRAALADMKFRDHFRRLNFPEGTEVSIVEQNGDRVQYSKTWSLAKSGLTSQALMAIVEKELSTDWKKTGASSNGSEKTSWSFDDDEGHSWTAEVTTHAEGEKLTVRVEVHKA